MTTTTSIELTFHFGHRSNYRRCQLVGYVISFIHEFNLNLLIIDDQMIHVELEKMALLNFPGF
jgi:hypothetical protein